MNNIKRITDIIRDANVSGEAWQYHIEALEGNANGVSTADLNEYVAEFIGLDSDDLTFKSDENNHDALACSLLAYVRTDMKKKGLITNPVQGTWFLSGNVNAESAKELGKRESAKRAAKKRSVADLRAEIVSVYRNFDNATKTVLKRAGVDKDKITELVNNHGCNVSEAYQIFLGNV